MISQKIKDKCLKQFRERYPDEDRVVVVHRNDGNIRVWNRNADSMIFNSRGCEIITHVYVEGIKVSDIDIKAAEATFECLPGNE